MVMTSQQQNQVDQQRERSHETLRATVPALEKILYTPIARLDHGFVRVVDYMGDDGAVVQAARVSYGRGTQIRSTDRTLIRYLMRHHHTTPFEMCEIKLHVKLPIFVARQWVRHRTANINEYSARYSILDREFYIPDPEVIASQSEGNRQGRGGGLGLAACQRGMPVGFTAAAMVHELMEARGERRLLNLQRQLSRRNLLIVDELGFVPLSRTGVELLFEVLSQRYERGSILVTTNLPFDERTEVFGSERLTGALLDRLPHHVHILEMNGDSYRLRHSRGNAASQVSD